MNKYVKKIGCLNTFFVNIHGMHGNGMYTTCEDMLKISQEILKNDLALKITGTIKYEA